MCPKIVAYEEGFSFKLIDTPHPYTNAKVREMSKSYWGKLRLKNSNNLKEVLNA